MEVTQEGFQGGRSELTPVTGQVVDLSLSVQVGGVAQAVEVTSEAPLVQEEASSVQTSVTETLTPGTAITDAGTESGQQDNRGLTVNGLRATQNNFTLDGANTPTRSAAIYQQQKPPIPGLCPELARTTRILSGSRAARRGFKHQQVLQHRGLRAGRSGKFGNSGRGILRRPKLFRYGYVFVQGFPFHRALAAAIPR